MSDDSEVKLRGAASGDERAATKPVVADRAERARLRGPTPGPSSSHSGRNSAPRGDGLLNDVRVTREQVDRFVLETVADAAAVEVGWLRQSTPLLDAQMDSLTLVAIVTRIEMTYGATFDTDELAEILRARSVGEVAAVVARKLRAT